MKKIRCEFHGVSPIILHSCQCVNPLHPLSREIKKITSKRNKTEEDLMKVRYLGRKSLDEVIGKIASLGLALKKEDE